MKVVVKIARAWTQTPVEIGQLVRVVADKSPFLEQRQTNALDRLVECQSLVWYLAGWNGDGSVGLFHCEVCISVLFVLFAQAKDLDDCESYVLRLVAIP